MKSIYILFYMLLANSVLSAQILKKESINTSSGDPLKIDLNLDVDLSADIDSTLIPKKLRVKIKEISSLVKKGKNNTALDLLKKINKNYYTNYIQGIIEFNLNNLNNSYSSFEESILLTSNDTIKSFLYLNLGIVDLKRGLPLSSYLNFEKSYKLNTSNLSSIIILGILSENKNDFDKAILYYEKAVKINPSLNNVWNNLGFLYQKKENYNKALNIFNKIIKDEPKSPLPYSNRSYSNLKLGYTKQALKDINMSIELFPTNSYAFKNRALIYIDLKKIDDACNDINTALKLGYSSKYGSDIILLKSKYCKR